MLLVGGLQLLQVRRVCLEYRRLLSWSQYGRALEPGPGVWVFQTYTPRVSLELLLRTAGHRAGQTEVGSPGN